MEGRALVAEALLARGQRAEVLGRLWHRLAVEAHDNATGRLIADGDVEEDLVRDLGALCRLGRLREAEESDPGQQARPHEQSPKVEHVDRVFCLTYKLLSGAGNGTVVYQKDGCKLAE